MRTLSLVNIIVLFVAIQVIPAQPGPEVLENAYLRIKITKPAGWRFTGAARPLHLIDSNDFGPKHKTTQATFGSQILAVDWYKGDSTRNRISLDISQWSKIKDKQMYTSAKKFINDVYYYFKKKHPEAAIVKAPEVLMLKNKVEMGLFQYALPEYCGIYATSSTKYFQYNFQIIFDRNDTLVLKNVVNLLTSVTILP